MGTTTPATESNAAVEAASDDPFRIAFIGGGNMAASLIGGLLQRGCSPARLMASDRSAERRQWLSERFKIAVTDDNAALLTADAVVLAVKPQVLQQVLTPLATTAQQHQPLWVSVVAGVQTASVERWLGGGHAIVRTMPNTPTLLGCGISGLVANGRVTAQQKARAEWIMTAGGPILWFEEEQALDAVTAISGSGPAYFFLFMESLERAAIELGLPSATARQLVLQTAFGAARMALADEEGPAALRRRVTSPNGVTERAIAALESGGFADLVERATEAAFARARELGELLKNDHAKDDPAGRP